MKKFQLHEKAFVDLKQEVEPSMRKFIPILEKNFIYRVLAFSLSGTEIVDLKSTESTEPQSSQAKIACRFKPSFLTNFLCQIVFNRRKIEIAPASKAMTSPASKSANGTQNIVLSEKFQESINIEFMQQNVSAESNGFEVTGHCFFMLNSNTFSGLPNI